MPGSSQRNLFAAGAIVLLGAALTTGSCKLQEAASPTSPTPSINGPLPPPTSTPPNTPGAVTVTTPGVVSPTPGTDLTTSQPTLIVSNSVVSDGSVPTYSYRVATDAELRSIVASVDGVAQGANGQTSWQVPRSLDSGRYFWRAQATNGTVSSNPSPLGDFSIRGPAEPRPAGVIISDPLSGRSSAGDVNGGRFTQQGWQVTSKDDYIRYEVPPIESGYVEWSNTNFYPRNGADDNYILFGMWDPTRGGYRANPFRVHIQKLDDRHNPPYIRLRWIANGEQHDRGYDFLNWDPRRVYTWRVDWGPDGGRYAARVYLNGQMIIEVLYTETYLPEVHWIELGVAERHESVVGAVYANFRVGSR